MIQQFKRYKQSSAILQNILNVLIPFFLFCGCSENKNDSLKIGEKDKSVFFLTSKGTYWWWIHKDENEKNWKLHITDVENRKVVSSTLFSNSPDDFEFSWQQTGDKLWYISPPGKLEARLIFNGDVSENHATIARKFMNLKGDIEKVADARPKIISGYILTTINGEQFHFNINEMLLSSKKAIDAALNFKTTIKTILVATDSCTGTEHCCISNLKWVTKAVSALSGDYIYNNNDTASTKIEKVTENSVYKKALLHQDELFAFVLWTKEKKLFFDCFEKKSQNLKWSVDTKIESNCEGNDKYSVSNLMGEILLQSTGKKPLCKVFRLADGEIINETKAEDLIDLNNSKD